MNNFFFLNKQLYYYFLFLFIFIPVSFVIGPAVSVGNILLIDLSFIILLIYKKEYSFIKNKSVRYLLLLYVYLIFNSLISFDQNIGITRNLGFIRLIIFFVAINYFFKQKLFFEKVFLSWSLFFLVIVVDIFIESYSGTNILGYGGGHAERLVSFFKDEPIVGGFINAFFFIIIGYLFNKSKSNFKEIIFLISIVILFSILLTGERSNTIKAFIAAIVFFFLYKEYSFKIKITLFMLILSILTLVVFNSSFLKLRYIEQTSDEIRSFKNNLYYKLQLSGFETFKNHKIFGVGNKNYRLITCQENVNPDGGVYNEKYFCSTHPHQIYFEFLSEHGLIGFLILIWIIYKLIFSKIKMVIKSNNYVHNGSFVYLLFTFTPLIPSGAFFGDYLITLFILNLSIFYGASHKLNIFTNLDIKKI